MNHNLNIQNYTLDEIFGLFHIPPRSIFTAEDLKGMKRQVLYTHPDKSKFPPEYFIFYKKAFEVMVQYYEANCKFYDVGMGNAPKKEDPPYPGYTGGGCGRAGPRVSGQQPLVSGHQPSVSGHQPPVSGAGPRVSSAASQHKPSVSQQQPVRQSVPLRQSSLYDPLNPHNASEEQIRSAMKSMPAGAFQSQFNQLYEQNTVDYASQQRAKKFGWFSDESTDLHVPTNVSKSNFDDSLEQVRRSSTAIIRREGGPTSYNVVSGAGDLYGEDDEDEDAEDVYIACDPFSKLKFDDLRKVHKDQTVFAVSERDFKPETKHQSVDMFNREWSKAGTATPLEKSQAEHILREQERARQERLANKQYLATQRTMEYEEKNKSFLSNFLRLT
jgi:hypothetical protein